MRVDVENASPDPVGAELSWMTCGLRDRSEYFESVITILSRLFPADSFGWNAIDIAKGEAEVYFAPPGSELDPNDARLLAELPDHPMVRSYLSEPVATVSRPRRMSDIVTKHELTSTQTYTDLLRPWGAEYMLTILTSRLTPSRARCWTVTRSTSDFTDTEVALAKALQPALVALDQARTELFAPHPSEPVREHNLTDREIEVLRHVALGLTATTIGRVLRISPLTVRKHLENAYAKLNCHDRMRAVDRARQLGLLDPPSAAMSPDAVLMSVRTASGWPVRESV